MSESTQARPAPRIPGFHFERLLGQGAFGAVFRARQEGLDRPVAVKVLRDAGYIGESARKRFIREGKVLGQLTHPNIVQVIDAGIAETGELYLAMQYVEGSDLNDEFAARGPDWRYAREILVPVARALSQAHAQGVLHRDLKPANIMIDRAGTPFLGDFGLASLVDGNTEELTKTGTLLGTPQYMAPELIRGIKSDTPADVWSLGAMLHLLVSGEQPLGWVKKPQDLWKRVKVEAPPLPEHVAPWGIRDLIERTLSRDPAKRPDAARFADLLESGEDDGKTELLPAGPSASDAYGAQAMSTGLEGFPGERPPRRRRLGLGLAGAALLAGGLWLGLHTPAPALPRHRLEYGPQGYRVHLWPSHTESVVPQGSSAETAPPAAPGGPWTSRWSTLPAELPVTRAFALVGPGGRDLVEVRVGEGEFPRWEQLPLPPRGMKILSSDAQPFPWHTRESRRSIGWVNAHLGTQAPLLREEFPPRGPLELALPRDSIPSGPVLVAVSLAGGGAGQGLVLRQGSREVAGFPAPDLAPGPARLLRILRLPAGVLRPGEPVQVDLERRGEGWVQHAWLGTAGDPSREVGDLEVLAWALRGRIEDLDARLSANPPQSRLNQNLLGGVIQVGVEMRLGRDRIAGVFDDPPWSRWFRNLEELDKELLGRLSTLTPPGDPRAELRLFYALQDFCRARELTTELFPQQDRKVEAPGNWGELYHHIDRMSFEVVSSRGNRGREGPVRDALESLLRRSPSGIRPWVQFLEARLELDAVARFYEPHSVKLTRLRRVLETIPRRDGEWHPPGGGIPSLLREVVAVVAATQDEKPGPGEGFRDPQGMGILRAAYQRLWELPSGLRRDRELAYCDRIMATWLEPDGVEAPRPGR